MLTDKIICVGKNYLDHALELGDPVPEKPVIFLKPASVLKQAMHWGESIQAIFPDDNEAVQPECEIVLCLARDGYNMTAHDAKQSIGAVSLGLDMTLRTRQAQLKKQGHPWTTAKVFPDAAIIGPWVPHQQFTDFMTCEFMLSLDGRLSQRAKGIEMMMHPIDLLMYVSQFFPLKAGDIIFTGTPAGVSSVVRGSTAQLQWGSYDYSVQWV